jgi:hypothetical protein
LELLLLQELLLFLLLQKLLLLLLLLDQLLLKLWLVKLRRRPADSARALSAVRLLNFTSQSFKSS